MKFNGRKFVTAILFSFILSLSLFAATASAEILFFEDFEEAETGAAPTELGGFTQTINKLSPKVVDDNGNKALRLANVDSDGKATAENLELQFGQEFSEGTYEFSYKVRFLSNKTYAHFFMTPFWRGSGSQARATHSALAVNYFWIEHNGLPNTGATASAVGVHFREAGWAKYADNTNTTTVLTEDYATVKTVVDFEKNIYQTYVITPSGTQKGGQVFSLGSEKISRLRTQFDTNQASLNGSLGGNAYTEFYIDDIKVEHFPISVVDKMEDTLISDVNQDIVIAFDQELTGVTAERIEIYKDESAEKLATSLYNVSYADKKITISFQEGMEYASSYEIKLGKGIDAVVSKYDPMIGSSIATFKTPEIFDGALSVSDDGKYNEPYALTIATAHGYSLTLKKDGNEIAFENGMSLSKGDYTLDIEMWTLNNSAKKYNKSISFSIYQAVAPVFTELKIKGEPKLNETLGVHYVYDDYNGDAEGVHEFYWLKSTDGTNFARVSDVPSASYLLEDKDINCYFKLEAYPVAENEPKKGEKHETQEVFAGPFKPIIKGDVTITATDVTVKVNYEYFDENGYEQKGTTFQWYRVSSPTSTTPVVITGATTMDYTFTDDDVDNYVYCVVTPKKEFEPYGDNEYKSEIISCPKKPVANGVGITGTAIVGGTLSASYSYDDPENDPLDKMIFEWYVNGSKYSESEAITLTSSMAGKSVYCVVTPVSQKFPFKGNSVTTETKYVSGSTSSLGGGSYSSGGGGSIGAGSYKDTEKVTEIVTTPTKPNENNTETKNEFSDIHNHWAKENVKRAVEFGFVNGKSENKFSPDINITRAEFATIIVRVLKLEMKKSDFIDISSDFWYNEYIGAVSSAGYMNGADGMFRPDDNITREEMCKVITNITGISEEIKEADFLDYENISDWAKQAVSKAYELGIVNGRNDGNFSPKDNSTRAEAVSVILRLYDYMKEAE